MHLQIHTLSSHVDHSGHELELLEQNEPSNRSKVAADFSALQKAVTLLINLVQLTSPATEVCYAHFMTSQLICFKI